MGQMRLHIFTNRATPNVIFMSGVFGEALHLLREAHDYFHQFGAEDQEYIDPGLKALYSCEMSRITLRLSSVMAWLMLQRAVFHGQVPAKDAARRGLEFQDICLVDNRMLHGLLPGYVCFLLDRSLELYERVHRLDEQVKTALPQIH